MKILGGSTNSKLNMLVNKINFKIPRVQKYESLLLA